MPSSVTMAERDVPKDLTSELVFERLEQLRSLLKLTDYLRGFRPKDTEASRPKPISST
jgi:hypothetical protein